LGDKQKWNLRVNLAIMWEKLKVYHQLDTKDIPSTFIALGSIIAEGLSDAGFVLTSTSSTIKLFKEDNGLEFSVFLLREKGGYYFDVKTSIKPVHFHHKHRFTMTNIKPLGEILDNYRRNSFPLTKEYELLAAFLINAISTKVQAYFNEYNSWRKIMKNRKKIEPKSVGLDNKYDLLIYASIWTENRKRLLEYIDKKLERPVRQITQAEYLKPIKGEANEMDFYSKIKELAKRGDFSKIQKLITE